ncbi:MAG: hypothetical protein ABGY96_06560 [bacterium]
MQPKTKEIIEKFPSGVVVKTKLEFKNLLRESQTKFYCYMVVADNMAGHIIGQGTGERAAFLFGGAAPGHIKAFTRAMLEHTSDDLEIIIFPVQPADNGKKPESIVDLEDSLQSFCPEFGECQNEDKNEILLDKRLQQLGDDISSDINQFLFPIIYAAGSEMSTFKKYSKRYPAEIRKGIKMIMGGFYTDI